MSSLKTGTPAGSITFAFENLCILLESGERRVFGDVTIAFDGAGAYWPVAMRLHGSEPKSPVMHVRYGIGLWREIMRRVEQYHAADVARLINEQLEARGVHMALFDEHAATMGRRPVPPHVRPAARSAPLLTRERTIGREKAFAAEAAALVLAAAGLMASALVSQPQHGRQGVRITTLYAGQGR